MMAGAGADVARPANLPSAGGGVGPGRAFTSTALEVYEDQDAVYVSMDPDIGIYESTHSLDLRLADRDFVRKDHTDYVTLADVEGEMDGLKTDKDLDDTIMLDIRKSLELLTKSTVMPPAGGDKRDKKLTAARICQIENRLLNDPSLRLDDEYETGKYPIEIPDNAAAHVKRSLIRTYQKIKKSSYDLSAVTVHQLDERMQILRKA